jgi:hypothetical protein
MKNKEFALIGKRILPSLPGFVVKNSMMLKFPIGDILYALDFDGSDFDARAFYVQIFFIPLYVPAKFIHFLFGKRLGSGGDRWDADAPNLISELFRSIEQEAIPFLKSVSTMQMIVEYIQPMTVPDARSYVNPHCQEALAYTLARMGDIAPALVVIDQMQEMLGQSTVAWELDIKARSQFFREKLLHSPKAAQAQLDAWKDETVRNLKLEAYRS